MVVMALADAWVASSREELLSGAASGVVVEPPDARSGSAFERVMIGGEPFFVKSVGYRSDWIMRVTGDRDLRTLKVWQAGVMADAPPEIDHAVVGMAVDGEREEAVLTILMRDVSDRLFADGDSAIAPEDHIGLVDGLAALSARYWGWTDPVGLMGMEERLRFFAPDNIAREAAVDDPPVVVRLAVQGWPRLAERVPDVSQLVRAIHADPRPLADTMRATPVTFVHGDWRMGNLGRHNDGRTILLDWALPGSGPVCWDLSWYLALNRARLPMTKEDTIEVMRRMLERRGIATAEWFDRQLELCLLAMLACFGWEKAMGDDTELDWWAEHARRAAFEWSALYPTWDL
jgi:hypothetical protein